LSEEIINQLRSIEGEMAGADKLAIETADAKNQVESYCYDMKDKVTGELEGFATKEDMHKYSSLISSTEEWLYDDGENATKSVYLERLNQLKHLGDPIVFRKNEFNARDKVVVSTRSTILSLKLSATSNDPKYDHIPVEDMKSIVKDCDELDRWLNQVVGQQSKLSKHHDPAFTVAEVNNKRNELEKKRLKPFSTNQNQLQNLNQNQNLNLNQNQNRNLNQNQNLNQNPKKKKNQNQMTWILVKLWNMS